MEIAGHVWMLQVSSAKSRFLVFGNQREVPIEWLRRYGGWVEDLDFYFIGSNANVELLNPNSSG
jgi:hypothetical protein